MSTSSSSSKDESDSDREGIEDLLRRIKVRQLDKIDANSFPYLVQKCYLIILVLTVLGAAYFYSAIISKFMPDTGFFILDAVKHDSYFCYLIPLMILPTLIVVYLQWLSMTLFQHTQN